MLARPSFTAGPAAPGPGDGAADPEPPLQSAPRRANRGGARKGAAAGRPTPLTAHSRKRNSP